MEIEKPIRTLYVEHTAAKSFKPDTVEFSVRIVSTKEVAENETADEARLALAKIHAPKAAALTDMENKTFVGLVYRVEIVEAETSFEQVLGETRSGKRVVERFLATTVVRYKTLEFRNIPLINDRVVALGGSSVFCVEFSIGDTDGYYSKVLTEAGAGVLIKAQTLSRAMNLRLGNAITVESGRGEQRRETYSESSPSMTLRATKSRRSEETGAPSALESSVIVPRAIEISATVKATYALTQ